MADNTGIEWADPTWNPVVGCSVVSPGRARPSQHGRVVALQPGRRPEAGRSGGGASVGNEKEGEGVIKPEGLSDDTLEYAATIIERISLTDIAGIAARRKRDREDATLRAMARKELRAEMAAHLRAMKDRPDLSPEAALARISRRAADGYDMVLDLRDAWPLAAMGWLNIYVTIRCNDNSVPPETRYSIELTERGRGVLASTDAEHR